MAEFKGIYEQNIGNNEHVVLLSIDSITSFHSYPFQLYEGEHLQNMVDSIKQEGIRFPIIVQKIENGYEILSGHNRQRGAKLIGFTQIPAIVKENLSEEMAYTYVIESNMIQRTFSDLLLSEKTAVIEWRNKTFNKSWYQEIVQELEKFHNKNISTYSYQIKGKNDIASTYGFSERNAARYLRLKYLIEPLKDMVDTNKLTLLAAVELSYLSVKEQIWIHNMIKDQGLKLNVQKAKELRKYSGSTLTNILVKPVDILFEYECSLREGLTLRMPKVICEKYFSEMNVEEIQILLEQILEKWFQEKWI